MRMAVPLCLWQILIRLSYIALGVGGRGREMFVLATCIFQFAETESVATLPQQEKSSFADEQRKRANFIRLQR